MGLHLPVPVRRSHKCDRCGLRYPRSDRECRHCSDLDERGLEALRSRVERDRIRHTRLGRLMMFLAALALLVVAILWL